MTSLWMALASVDMMSWGVGQVVVKRATDRLGAVTMVLLASVVDGLAYLVLFLVFGGPFSASWPTYAFAILSAVSGMGGYILYYEALLRGSVGVVGTISGAAPVVTILGATAFLGEIPTASQAIGLVLLVAVVLILTYEPVGEHWKLPVAVILSIAILILWGVWALFTKLAVGDPGMGPWNILAFYTAANALMGPPYYLWRRRRAPPEDPSRRAYGVATGGLLLLMVGIVALTLALAFGPASLVSAVSGTYPVVTVLVAFFVLREKMTASRIVAIALFLPGIVLIAM